MKEKIFGFSDCHGDYYRVLEILREHAIIDNNADWIAGNSTLVHCGDMVDSGPYGIKCIDLLRKLENQAALAGGCVVSLMGNCDAIMLANAYIALGECSDQEICNMFHVIGGAPQEAVELAHNHDRLEWMKNRPLIYKKNNLLFQHADTCKYYLSLGKTIQEINERGAQLARTPEGAVSICSQMCAHRQFEKNRYSQAIYENNITNYLNLFNVTTIIHGHTPIKESLEQPYIYADNHIINIDGRLSIGKNKNATRGYLVSFDVELSVAVLSS